MENYLDKKTISNLKEKIDVLVQDVGESSKDLSVDERYNIMKKLILEGIDKAFKNSDVDIECEVSEEEFDQRKDKLIDFVREYFEEKFSEILAMELNESGGEG